MKNMIKGGNPSPIHNEAEKIIRAMEEEKYRNIHKIKIKDLSELPDIRTFEGTVIDYVKYITREKLILEDRINRAIAKCENKKLETNFDWLIRFAEELKEILKGEDHE